METELICLRQEEVRVIQPRSGRVAHKGQKEPGFVCLPPLRPWQWWLQLQPQAFATEKGENS